MFKIFIQCFVILMNFYFQIPAVSPVGDMKPHMVVRKLVCRRKELLNALKYVLMEMMLHSNAIIQQFAGVQDLQVWYIYCNRTSSIPLIKTERKNRLVDVCFKIFIQSFVISMDFLLVFVNLAQSLKLSTIVKMMVCRRKELLNALKYVWMETEYIRYLY